MTYLSLCTFRFGHRARSRATNSLSKKPTRTDMTRSRDKSYSGVCQSHTGRNDRLSTIERNKITAWKDIQRCEVRSERRGFKARNYFITPDRYDETLIGPVWSHSDQTTGMSLGLGLGLALDQTDQNRRCCRPVQTLIVKVRPASSQV